MEEMTMADGKKHRHTGIKRELIRLLGQLPCDGPDPQMGGCPFRRHGVCREVDKLDYCAVQAFADHLIANGVTIQKWIPVTERLPESGVHVLVACEMYGQYLHGQYVCDGFYVDRYTQKVANTEYDIACEYCEEDDEYYLWQGWYEVIKNWDDYNSIVIGDTVTHWMPLPEPPKGEGS